ncbi:hypothetical protein ACFLU4_01905 [Chloroflexota bacterium]
MKIITCPHCGKVAAILGIGRAATNLVVTDICDALRLCRSVPSAAEKLGCSRALIYKILKKHDMSPADVIKGLAPKDNNKLNYQRGGNDESKPGH